MFSLSDDAVVSSGISSHATAQTHHATEKCHDGAASDTCCRRASRPPPAGRVTPSENNGGGVTKMLLES